MLSAFLKHNSRFVALCSNQPDDMLGHAGYMVISLQIALKHIQDLKGDPSAGNAIHSIFAITSRVQPRANAAIPRGPAACSGR